MSIRDRLKYYRKVIKDWTQQEMAEKLGIGTSTYRTWEGGRVKFDSDFLVGSVADRLGVSADWLKGIAPVTEHRVGKAPVGEKGSNPVAFLEGSDVLYSYDDYTEEIDPSQYEITQVEAPNMEVKTRGNVVFHKLTAPQIHLIVNKVEYDQNGEKIRESGQFVRILMKPKKKP